MKIKLSLFFVVIVVTTVMIFLMVNLSAMPALALEVNEATTAETIEITTEKESPKKTGVPETLPVTTRMLKGETDSEVHPARELKPLVSLGSETFVGYIVTNNTTELIKIPIDSDFFRNDDLLYELFYPGKGIELEVKDIYSFRDSETGVVYRYSILPHVNNSKSVILVELDNGLINSDQYSPTLKNYETLINTENSSYSRSTYVAEQHNIYINKIYNIITALQNINGNQESLGGFKAGEIYSYLDLINMTDSYSSFLPGRNGGGYIVRGGDVCAMATTLSETLFYTAQTRGLSSKGLYVERWTHQNGYFHGPFSSKISETDATVELSNDGTKYDLRWIQPVDGFLEIGVVIKPNGAEVADPLDKESPYDVMVTLSFTEEDVTEKNKVMLLNALSVMNGDTTENLRNVKKNVYLTYDNLSSRLQNVVNEIYPIYNTKNFEKELLDPDSYLHDIFLLQEAINSIPENYDTPVSKYLRTSEWYKKSEKTKVLEGAINELDFTNVEGQPVQCFGYVDLLSAINNENENLQIKHIGGAYSFGDGSIPAVSAT